MKRELKATLYSPKRSMACCCRVNPYEEGTESSVIWLDEFKNNIGCRVNPYEEGTERKR